MISGFTDLGKVIYEAAERLGISNSEGYELRFLSLVIDAQKKIGTGSITGIKYNLYEVGNSAFDGRTLLQPHDMLDSLEVLDKDGEKIDSCEYNFHGNKVLFAETQTDPIILKYNGLLLDLNDSPWISNNHFEAVVAYLVYMITTTKYFSKQVPRYIYIDAQTWWQDRLMEARGNDAFATEEQFGFASAKLYSVKLFLDSGKEKICPNITSINDLLFEYMSLSDIKYGILDLNTDLIVEGDYTEGVTLDPEIDSTVGEMSGNNFFVNIVSPGYLVVVVPQSEGTIISMKDANNNDIFPNYFNIIKDDTKDIRIYKAVNFLNIGTYKLTFKFLNP